MEKIITKLFVRNWPRKLFALFIGLTVWIFVNHSLTATVTLPGVPVRVVNIPQDKTIIGLLPNGHLKGRISLTLTGTRDVISELEPSDLEVVVDAATAPSNEWVVNITKRNLLSLNPSINLLSNITKITYGELLIKFSELVTKNIPIHILPPEGAPPHGFELLDIWPGTLYQTISGPKEELEALAKKGLEFKIDLQKIDQEAILASYEKHKKSSNEVSFPIPAHLREIVIPFRHNSLERINDPRADLLRIDFLKEEYLPLHGSIQIDAFYPAETSLEINPETYPIQESALVERKNFLTFLNAPLYIRNVSILFLDIINPYLKIFLILEPNEMQEDVRMSTQVLGMRYLENAYVLSMQKRPEELGLDEDLKSREEVLRKRFRKYMHRLQLYGAPEKPLQLEGRLKDHVVEVSLSGNAR